MKGVDEMKFQLIIDEESEELITVRVKKENDLIAKIETLVKEYAVESLTGGEVVTGIFSSTLLAFIVAGITVVHTVDKLSTFLAALIQGVVLYIDYILLYLFNGWLQSSLKPIMIFTVCFVLGYLIIWAIVFVLTRKCTKKLNESLN